MTRLLVLLLLLIPSIAFPWTRTLTFESGSVGTQAHGTSDSFSYAGTNVTIDNARAHNGSKSAKVHWVADSTENYPQALGEVMFSDIGQPNVGEGGEIWYRAYIFYPSGFNWCNTVGVKQMRISPAGGYPCDGQHSLKSESNNYGYECEHPELACSFWNDCDGSGEWTATTHSWPSNRWAAFEMYVKASSGSGGRVRIWLDGVLKMNYSGPTIVSGCTLARTIFASVWNYGPCVTQDQWVDDIVITTNTPSNTDSNGYPFIGLTTGGGNSSPSITITGPTSSPTYNNGTNSTVNISGTAADSDGTISQVAWSCSTCTPTAGAASGSTSWSFGPITVGVGSNIILVTATDNLGATGSDSITVSRSATPANDPPGLWKSIHNPRYFAKNNGSGDIVYLAGSHTWLNFQDAPPEYFDFDAYLSFISGRNHNFIRLWNFVLPKEDCGGGVSYTDPMPWNRTGPGYATDGGLKFDLTSFNQDYFDRLRARIQAADAYGMYVSVMLFNGFDLNYCRLSTDGFPMTYANNINDVDAGTGTEALTLNDAAVTSVQQAYVRKVIDTVHDLDNVLYEIANEGAAVSVAWQKHLIDYIKSYEASMGYTPRPVGMTGDLSIYMSDLTSSNADWISPYYSDTGGYDYRTNPRPSDGTKIIISDTDHLWGFYGSDRDWVWKTFTRGGNPIYMDCYNHVSTGCSGVSEAEMERNRVAMGYTRALAANLDLANMTPSQSIASTGYALVKPDASYLAYQPGSGAFTVNLSATDETFTTYWFNPVTGGESFGSNTVGGAVRSMTPPWSGMAVLKLTALEIAPPPPVGMSTVGGLRIMQIGGGNITLSW